MELGRMLAVCLISQPKQPHNHTLMYLVSQVMSNFYHMARSIGSESLKRRLQCVDFVFAETVREILDALQVIAFLFV